MRDRRQPAVAGRRGWCRALWILRKVVAVILTWIAGSQFSFVLTVTRPGKTDFFLICVKSRRAGVLSCCLSQRKYVLREKEYG